MNQVSPVDAGKRGDETLIRGMLDAQEKSWDDGDSISWGAPYSEDADCVITIRRFTKNQRKIPQFFRDACRSV